MASLPAPATLVKLAPVAFKLAPELTQQMVTASLVRTVPTIVRRRV
jgi:hypothetical protein